MEQNTATTLCPCCMETHALVEKEITETNIFQEQEVSYTAKYIFCPETDEYYATEQQMRVNDIAMKDAYRKALGRLTSSDIAAIRAKYQVSQSDFAKILGFGEKTITRYESFQVQTEANDSVLKKVSRDPEWYLELLANAKGQLTDAAYEKSKRAASGFFAETSDEYQRNALAAVQARFGESGVFHGFRTLSISKIIDVINYFASSRAVSSLYSVKLMKMLWYGDSLCYKRHKHSITGLAYVVYPMGAVPAGYPNIMELTGICCEIEEIQDHIGYHFICDEGYVPRALTEEEILVLDTVIRKFGRLSKQALIDTMHQEVAYTETHKWDAIAYTHTEQLSID